MIGQQRAEAWGRVTRHEPCPICEKGDWCKVSPDGAVACCMRITDGAFKLGQLKTGEPYGLHRLRDDRPYEGQPPTFIVTPAPEDDAGFDVLTARAVYGATAAHCAASLTDRARAELARRFGPVYGPQAAERFGLGYCNSPELVKALDAGGRRTDAIAAGVLHPQRGQAVRSIGGRITIPYMHGGGTFDLRGAGIKGVDETKEMSLPGGYVERGVAGLFFNHDALDTLPVGEPLHLAGGAYKAMALALSGLPAVGTRGEAELSDAQLAALVEAGVTDVILHIDAEEPKEGQTLSAGRRLGLPKAERLAAAGFAVSVAEPPREPGTPKVDPDALLRDLGPRAVRDYALSALSLEAWRVVIGVELVGVSPEVAAEIEALRRNCASAQRQLTNVVYIRKNGEIKAERDALTASVLHMAAAQAQGRATPSGRIRQPLWGIADSVGKTKPTVSKHLKLGCDEGLFDRELLEEVIVRTVDEETGQTRDLLRLKDATGRVVEECPAEQVLGVGIAYRRPTGNAGEEATGAYYVTPKYDPDTILDILVTLKPDRGDKKGWGGERECCPECKSLHRVRIVACRKCGYEFERKDDPPPADTPITSADLRADQAPDEPAADAPSIPPTPVAVPLPPATYPLGAPVYAREEESEEQDDWDERECNHPGCVRPIVIGQRYCGQHRHMGLEPDPPRIVPPTEPAPAPAPLDDDIVQQTAQKTSLAAIDAQLAGYRERQADGEDSPQLHALSGDWGAIRAARVALDAAVPALTGDD